MIKSCILALLMAFVVPACAQSTYSVTPDAARVLWKGTKITGEHTGTIKLKSGTLDWGAEGLMGGEVVIDMTSITNTDMEREWAVELEDQLRSSDFFDTRTYGTATFKVTNVSPIAGAEAGKPNYTITGNLTIKDITHPVTFKVIAWKEKKAVRAAGVLSFDRTLYDIKYRSGRFFPSLGDKMIDDVITLTFDITGR